MRPKSGMAEPWASEGLDTVESHYCCRSTLNKLNRHMRNRNDPHCHTIRLEDTVGKFDGVDHMQWALPLSSTKTSLGQGTCLQHLSPEPTKFDQENTVSRRLDAYLKGTHDHP